jgi:hypothetical protein
MAKPDISDLHLPQGRLPTYLDGYGEVCVLNPLADLPLPPPRQTENKRSIAPIAPPTQPPPAFDGPAIPKILPRFQFYSLIDSEAFYKQQCKVHDEAKVERLMQIARSWKHADVNDRMDFDAKAAHAPAGVRVPSAGNDFTSDQLTLLKQHFESVIANERAAFKAPFERLVAKERAAF